MLEIIICLSIAKIMPGLINLYSKIRLKIFLSLIKNLYVKNAFLCINKASSHSSDDSLEILYNMNINYLLIPSDMTSILQPMDLSVNKVFKDNIRYSFEKDWLLYDNIMPKNKLEISRLNIINYVNNIWNNINPINKNIIINGFEKARKILFFFRRRKNIGRRFV